MRTSPPDPVAPRAAGGARPATRLRWPADPLAGEEPTERPERPVTPAEDRPGDPGPIPDDLREEVRELRRAVEALGADVQEELRSLRREVAALRRRLPLRAAPDPDPSGGSGRGPG